MRKYKTLIIDDEEKSIDVLLYLIDEYCPELEVIRTFTNPVEGLQFIQNSEFDILMLDIQMPEIDGFQLLDKVGKINFNIVFITAYDEYALKAFRYFALDYLMKPVESDMLGQLINRLTARHEPTYNQDDLRQIFGRLGNNIEVNHLAVPTKTGVEFVLFDEIIRLQSDSNYTNIIRKDAKNVFASKTLKHFENLLPPAQFFRAHQSHIINLKYMKSFLRQDGGYILMEDDEEITLARSKRQEFIERFL